MHATLFAATVAAVLAASLACDGTPNNNPICTGTPALAVERITCLMVVSRQSCGCPGSLPASRRLPAAPSALFYFHMRRNVVVAVVSWCCGLACGHASSSRHGLNLCHGAHIVVAARRSPLSSAAGGVAFPIQFNNMLDLRGPVGCAARGRVVCVLAFFGAGPC
jgi:hypothetical protein